MTDLPVAILGAGAWGTALSVALSRGGRQVTLCPRRLSQAQELASTRENAAYLPGIELPQTLKISNDWPEALSRCEVAIIAIPSAFVVNSLTPVVHALKPQTVLVSATKGIDGRWLQTMTQALAELTSHRNKLAVLSGPGFAAEIARGKPAALVAASSDEAVATLVQRLLAVALLRVYRSDDVIGVELGGAIKNVIAIAAGISDGLDLGSSAGAALITRGLAEIMRLGTAMGARRETLAGLAGLGDLVLTCTGGLSRNRAYGLRLGNSRASQEDRTEAVSGEQVAEGATNARLIRDLARRWSVEMPIVAAVCRCLYEGEAPRAMVKRLFSRELKAEF